MFSLYHRMSICNFVHSSFECGTLVLITLVPDHFVRLSLVVSVLVIAYLSIFYTLAQIVSFFFFFFLFFFSVKCF